MAFEILLGIDYLGDVDGTDFVADRSHVLRPVATKPWAVELGISAERAQNPVATGVIDGDARRKPRQVFELKLVLERILVLVRSGQNNLIERAP
jgi:hypothetical protein